ncbi:unnamed protein product, partial [Protopolystoma xenopodis]
MPFQLSHQPSCLTAYPPTVAATLVGKTLLRPHTPLTIRATASNIVEFPSQSRPVAMTTTLDPRPLSLGQRTALFKSNVNESISTCSEKKGSILAVRQALSPKMRTLPLANQQLSPASLAKTKFLSANEPKTTCSGDAWLLMNSSLAHDRRLVGEYESGSKSTRLAGSSQSPRGRLVTALTETDRKSANTAKQEGRNGEAWQLSSIPGQTVASPVVQNLRHKSVSDLGSSSASASASESESTQASNESDDCTWQPGM